MAWAMKDVNPLRVTASGGRQVRSGEGSGNIYDHFAATFDYPGGVKGFHQSRQIPNCSGENKAYFWGTTGWADINPWSGRHKIEGDNPLELPTVDYNHTAQMYQTEHDELFAAIRADKPINDSPWMAHSTMLAIMLRMSAYTGKTITWEDALSSEEDLSPEVMELGDCPMRPVPMPGKTRFF